MQRKRGSQPARFPGPLCGDCAGGSRARSLSQRVVSSDSAARRCGAHRSTVERCHDLRPSSPGPTAPGIASALACRLARSRVPRLADALNLALVLVADHGLAASTLAARVAANTRAPLYSSIQAAIAALQDHAMASPRPGRKSCSGRSLRAGRSKPSSRSTCGGVNHSGTRATTPVATRVQSCCSKRRFVWLRAAERRRCRSSLPLRRIMRCHPQAPSSHSQPSLTASASSVVQGRRSSPLAEVSAGLRTRWRARAFSIPLRMRATYIEPRSSPVAPAAAASGLCTATAAISRLSRRPPPRMAARLVAADRSDDDVADQRLAGPTPRSAASPSGVALSWRTSGSQSRTAAETAA